MTPKEIEAERALLLAAIACPHEIDDKRITLHFDARQEGHNALNQLSRRLAAARASIRPAQAAEPVAEAKGTKMIGLMEETANMLRGMCMDPRIPQDTKEAIRSRVRQLDSATEKALEAPALPQGLQEVHAVQWYAEGGRTRCLEVFDDISPARVFADHLPTGASAWITTMAVRGETYARAFCGGLWMAQPEGD